MTASSERVRMPPRHELSPEDIKRASEAWFKTIVRPPHRHLIRALNVCLREDFQDEKDRAYLDKVLSRGGTFPRWRLSQLASVSEKRDPLQIIDSLRLAMKGVTGINYERSNLKANGVFRPGIGPHRDATLDKGATDNNLSITAAGRAKFHLWVVPEACEVDTKDALFTPEAGDKTPLIVEVDGRERSLYPAISIDTYPGVAININETPGVGTWEGPEGHTELWHSAAHVSKTPRLVVVLRDNRPLPSA